MENLIFSLNATMPIFLLMLLGIFFRKTGFMNEGFTSQLNRFVFRIALPVLLFKDLAEQDFAAAWDGSFVLFCFCVTCISIALVSLISRVAVHGKAERGEFIQAAYRSSAALLGIAFIHNIYGEESSAMGPLMILGSVPLYNIAAVTVLVMTAEGAEGPVNLPETGTKGAYQSLPAEGTDDACRAHRRLPVEGRRTDSRGSSRRLLLRTVKNVLTNPLILGILIGFVWSLLRIPQPQIMKSVVSSVSALATPLGLMAMGASFDLSKARKSAGPALLAAFIKLFGLAALFLPVAVKLGFRNEQLIAILVMLGSSTTVSSFVMAKNMGHEGTLTASAVMLTTLGAAFSLTFWLYVLKSLGMI